MEKELNLIEILKGCPSGTKLYSPIYGECELVKVEQDVDSTFSIKVNVDDYDDVQTFTKNGHFFSEKMGECLLFPSKNNRDWSTFKVEKEKTKEVITHTLHRILDLATTKKNLVGAEMSNESVMNVVSVLAKDTLEYIDKYWER